MATTNSIGTASRDYSTLQAWEDAVPSTPTGGYIGECYNDSQFTGQLTIAGHTTSATDFITLTTATGQSFIDDSGVLTNPQYYDQAQGAGVSNGGDGPSITISDNYTIVEKIQIKKTGGFFSTPTLIRIDASPGTGTIVRNVIAGREYTIGNDTQLLTMYSGKVVNSLFYQTGSNGGEPAIYFGGPADVINCAFINKGSAGSTVGYALAFATGSVIKNCAFFGWATAERIDAGGSPTPSYNATNLASGFSGSGHVYNLVQADQYESTSDFRLKSGNSMAAGTRDAANTGDLDIVGQARDTTTPCIGQWEFISGGGGGTVVEKTAEDGILLSDGGMLSRERGAVATDTLLVTDASGFSREHQVSASDAFDLLDEASFGRMVGRVSNDGLAVQDEMSWHRLLFRLADDALTLIDAITAATSGGVLHDIVATDAILLSDGTLKAVFLDRLAESGIELSDQAQQALQRLRELGDTLLIEDGSIRTVSRYRRLDTALEVWDEAIPALNQHTAYTADVRILFGAQPSGVVFGSDERTLFGGYN